MRRRSAAFRGFLRRLRSPRSRHLPDSRIFRKNEFAGTQGRFLKIRSVGGKHLPARCFLPQRILPQNLNGSHCGEVPPQAPVVILGGREPHSVIRLAGFVFVSEDEDNFVLNINSEAAEHGTRSWRQRRKRFQHKLMRNSLARPRSKRSHFAGCGFTPDHVQFRIFQPPASACSTKVICPSSAVGWPLSL